MTNWSLSRFIRGNPPRSIRTQRPHGRSAMLALLASGMVRPGDPFIWWQPRRGVLHVAVVGDDGRLTVLGEPFDSPSPAAKYACGTPVDGWLVWRCARDGRTLNEKRDRIFPPATG